MNLKLSKKRADAVVEYMLDQGVSESQLVARYFGEAHPVRKGTSARALAKNRRVELILMKEMPVAGWGASQCGAEHNQLEEHESDEERMHWQSCTLRKPSIMMAAKVMLNTVRCRPRRAS